MKEKLFVTKTLLGTEIYAYEMTRDDSDTKEYKIIHCDDEGNEVILRYLNYKVVKEKSEGVILQKEVSRVTDIFDEGMRFGQKILKHGFKN